MSNEKGKMKTEESGIMDRKDFFVCFLSFFTNHFSFLICICIFIFSSCAQMTAPTPHSPFPTFRDIPGVTAEEIAAIEALQQTVLQKQSHSLIFGTPLNTEAFIDVGGKFGGYIALYCDWLSELFGIQITPEIFFLCDMLDKLNSRDLDFGIVRGREELRNEYFVTDSIGQRMIIMMRVKGSEDLLKISTSRLPRYAFIQASSTYDMVSDALASDSYEAVFVANYQAGYDMLKNGEADALIEANIIEGAFLNYDDAYPETFLPLLFNPIVMITANEELEPIISVVTKALQNGAMPYLIRLYEDGYRDYQKHKMSTQLSDKEREYIASHPVVPFVANYDNYPVCFYNTREGEWQGMFFDLIDEVTNITGLSFNIINKSNDDWSIIYEMVKSGEASLAAEMVRAPEREAYFIWPETGMPPDYFALISKSDYRNLTINEIMDAKVGLAQNTVYASTFKYWFPNHTKTVEYENMDKAVSALQRGEVDLVMSTQRRLMYVTHFLELPGYKTNMIFDQPLQSLSGVNKNEELLCSIIDKALKVIDTSGISDRWMRRTYDYRAIVAEARLPWFIGASVLSLAVLGLILIMFFRNRNEGKRLAKLVTEKTSTLTAILDATPDLIFCKDLNSCFTECNKATEKHFKRPKSDIIGKDNSQALSAPSELAAQYTADDKRTIDEKQVFAFEEYIPSPGGELMLFEIIKTPLIQDGEVTGLVAMARDITKRKAAEDEAKRASSEAMKAYAEAEVASEAKSRFIANMSHEMRTPMNVIVGLTDLMLEEEGVPGKAKEMLKNINTAGNTLMGLINDVLDISKIEAGKMELKPVQYDVASLLNDIITLNVIRIGEKPIVFKLDLNEDVLPRTLLGDDLRIKQILNNLLSNAFKYTKEGTVSLRIECQIEGTNESANSDATPHSPLPTPHSLSVWVTLCVSDTGIGIRKEDMAKLFSDYNQVDTRANREIEGTGLGLNITKKFVDLMDGEITVESEYGKGTSFLVRIRQGFVTDALIGKETVESLRSFWYTDKKRQAQKKLVRHDLSYARVLVVDDFPMNLDVAVGMLKKYKMQVDCVLSGQEAVDRIAAGEPVYDVIFMDHMMPGMDGVEATLLIRKLGTEYAKNIPVIALTANVVAGNEEMFLKNGFNAYLPKPFNVMSLDSIIQQWVRDKAKEK
ncbi:MAG: transporter substrate-binding domain-containing protein [Treponema sp.]|jgi:PAS domain S-box-containing protein|nr:transporter substrate-binding domain-containing protein [Treponema sp.]